MFWLQSNKFNIIIPGILFYFHRSQIIQFILFPLYHCSNYVTDKQHESETQLAIDRFPLTGFVPFCRDRPLADRFLFDTLQNMITMYQSMLPLSPPIFTTHWFVFTISNSWLCKLNVNIVNLKPFRWLTFVQRSFYHFISLFCRKLYQLVYSVKQIAQSVKKYLQKHSTKICTRNMLFSVDLVSKMVIGKFQILFSLEPSKMPGLPGL